MSDAEVIELLVVGAGPCGLAVGVAARNAGLPCVLLDRRNIVATIERYPLGMTFFSTPERIEIGDVPFIASHEKPTRRDGMLYYRRVAEHYQLDVRPFEEVLDATKIDGGFRVSVGRPHDTKTYHARALVFATGYYDNPNFLSIPGEDLPHVTHYFVEGHPYWRRRVVIVGAGNSAVDAALESWRAGAIVTLVHRREQLDATVKAWVLPDITNRIREGSIAVRWRSRLQAIAPTHVEILHEDTGDVECLPTDAVLAMTGYHADTTLLQRLGVPVDGRTGVPEHDETTMATTVDGCYLAGVVAAGNDANRLFIENARGHGDVIVRHLLARRTGR